MADVFDLERLGGEAFLQDLIDEVRASGALARELFDAGVARTAERKPDLSPVTAADREVEARLRAFVTSRFPAAGFVGEEEGESGAAGASVRFIVDPIDGTRAFVRGIPTWSVLVGIEVDGEPVVGVAFLPTVDQMFVGVKGCGAACNGVALHVSAIESLEDAVVSHGALLQFRAAQAEHLLTRIATSTYTQYGFCDFPGYAHVLFGRVDAMIDPGVKPWDLCAVAVLVREAGGEFTAIDGTRTLYGGSGLATNGRIHGALVELLR